MSWDWVTAIGFLAALCSTTSFAPQAWKIIRERDVSGLSAKMYAFTVAGFALWLLYGLAKWEWPLILTNGVCLIFASFILAMILLPTKKREQVAESLNLQKR